MATSLLSKILCVFTLSGICFGATDFAEKYLQRSYKECQSKAMSGRDYKGRMNVTKDGIPCQRWNKSEPHKHPFSYVGDHNYCRNPIEAPVSEVLHEWPKCKIPVLFSPILPTTSSPRLLAWQWHEAWWGKRVHQCLCRHWSTVLFHYLQCLYGWVMVWVECCVFVPSFQWWGSHRKEGLA